MKKRIEIRIFEHKKNEWNRKAKEQYSTLTDYIINKVEDNFSVKDINKIELFLNKIVNKRKKVENNINQIARNINISKSVNERQMMQYLEFLNEYKEVVKEQNKSINKLIKTIHTK